MSFAHWRGFDSAHLLDPVGIYWLPPLSYVVNGAVLAVSGDGLSGARAASLAEILGCLILLGRIMKTLPSEANWLDLLALAAWGINIQIFIAGNTARPEALCLLLNVAALAASIEGKVWGCLALAVLSAMTHPLLALPSLAIAAVMIVKERRFKPNRWEQIALAGAAAIILIEAIRFLGESADYVRQFAFQLHRKGDRPLSIRILAVSFLTIGSLLLPVLRTGLPRPFLLCLTFACANLLVYVYGREMWYGPLLVTALFCMALAARSLPLPGKILRLAPACFLAAIGISWFLACSPILTGNGLKKEQGFAGQSLDPAALRHVAADRSDIKSKLSMLLRNNQGDILAAPSAYADFVGHEGEDRVYSFNNFSEPDERRNFQLYVEVFAIQLRRESDLDERLLAGYRCTAREIEPTPQGRFMIETLVLEKTGEREKFAACPSAPNGQ